MRYLASVYLAILLLTCVFDAYAADQPKEVNSLIKCVENNTINNAIKELNVILATEEVTENIGKQALHINDFTSSSPTIKYNRNAQFITVCVTLNRKTR